MMHLKIKLMALIFFIIITKALSAQTERGVKMVNPTSGKAYYDDQENWAVLIGINKFRYLTDSNLNFAVADAESIRDLIINEFGYKDDHIILLTDEQATSQRIRKELGDKLRRMVKENDRVLVFWAGHGYTHNLPRGGKMGFLIPQDGNIMNELYSTCLSMGEINNFANLIPAKHILFLVDACFSGLAANQIREINKDYINRDSANRGYIEKITNLGVRQIITAGGEGETVIESSRWGHSAFTYELIKGLKEKKADYDGDGVITTTELAAYLKPRVTKRSNDRQTPQYKTLDGEGEFVFVPKTLLQPTRLYPKDNNPPQILNRTGDRTKEKKSFLVRARVSDDMSDVASVLLAYKTNSTDGWEKVFMRQKTEDIYEYSIPESQVKSPVIAYYFAAGDRAGNKKVLTESKNMPFITTVEGIAWWKKMSKIIIPPAVGFFIAYLIYRNTPGTIDISVDTN